jgi:TetR/AcrR family transcriptional regulator
MVHNITPDWTEIYPHILELERDGLVTRTFRRLDPERQQLVVNAILDEAIEKGPAAINIKQVAERAGVAIGSLYQYFGNRDGLLDFTTTLCVRLLTAMFEESKPYLVAMPLREGLSMYLLTGIEWSATMMGLVQFFGRAAYVGDPALTDKVVRPVAVAMQDVIRAMLEAARQRGEIRPEVDFEAAVRLVNLAMIAVGDGQLLPYLNEYYLLTDDKVSRERIVSALVEMILGGIGARMNEADN